MGKPIALASLDIAQKIGNVITTELNSGEQVVMHNTASSSGNATILKIYEDGNWTSGTILDVSATPQAASNGTIATLRALGTNWSSGASVLKLITSSSNADALIVNDGSSDVVTIARTGNITTAGDVILSGGGKITTTSNQILNIVPNGTGYTKFGDAGSPSHIASTNDNVYVSGYLEVQQRIHVDGEVNIWGAGGFTLIEPSAENVFWHQKRYTNDGIHLCVGEGSGWANRNIIITTYGNRDKSHGHTSLSANPTIFLHSSTDPTTDNTQYLKLLHDTTNGIIGTGKGDLVLDPASAKVNFNSNRIKDPEYITSSGVINQVAVIVVEVEGSTLYVPAYSSYT